MRTFGAGEAAAGGGEGRDGWGAEGAELLAASWGLPAAAGREAEGCACDRESATTVAGVTCPLTGCAEGLQGRASVEDVG